jgi:hypothetical protein
MGFMDKGPWQFAKDAISRGFGQPTNIPPAPRSPASPLRKPGATRAQLDPMCTCCESRTYQDGSYNSYSEVCEICFVDCLNLNGAGARYLPSTCQNRQREVEEGISDQEFEKYRNKIMKKIK